MTLHANSQSAVWAPGAAPIPSTWTVRETEPALSEPFSQWKAHDMIIAVLCTSEVASNCRAD
jgi:hypothetical protein